MLFSLMDLRDQEPSRRKWLSVWFARIPLCMQDGHLKLNVGRMHRASVEGLFG